MVQQPSAQQFGVELVEQIPLLLVWMTSSRDHQSCRIDFRQSANVGAAPFCRGSRGHRGHRGRRAAGIGISRVLGPAAGTRSRRHWVDSRRRRGERTMDQRAVGKVGETRRIEVIAMQPPVSTSCSRSCSPVELHGRMRSRSDCKPASGGDTQDA